MHCQAIIVFEEYICNDTTSLIIKMFTFENNFNNIFKILHRFANTLGRFSNIGMKYLQFSINEIEVLSDNQMLNYPQRPCKIQCTYCTMFC